MPEEWSLVIPHGWCLFSRILWLGFSLAILLFLFPIGLIFLLYFLPPFFLEISMVGPDSSWATHVIPFKLLLVHLLGLLQPYLRSSFICTCWLRLPCLIQDFACALNFWVFSANILVQALYKNYVKTLNFGCQQVLILSLWREPSFGRKRGGGGLNSNFSWAQTEYGYIVYTIFCCW